MRLVGTRVILGGGLNNMLMNTAQMLAECCCSKFHPDGSADTRHLVLPRLDSDPLRPSGTKGRQVPLLFRDVFDAGAFVRGVRPCRAIDATPDGPGAVDTKTLTPLPAKVFGPASASSPRLEHTAPQPIRGRWNGSSHLARVYSAARPSEGVARLLRALEAEAVRRAGPRWDAVHLTIEKDWWWSSSFCAPRLREGRIRRCFAPSEVARAIAPARGASGATGTVLLYAYDKVSDLGPPVCASDFGPNTVKLVLQSRTPAARMSRAACVADSSCYTIRNAAEQFLAAMAPAGFYGNRFSTFSKGVALMRAGAAAAGEVATTVHVVSGKPWRNASHPRARRYHGGGSRKRRGDRAARAARLEHGGKGGDWDSLSFAYDCATSALEVIKPVFTAHPGFHLLRPLGQHADGGQYSRGGMPCPAARPASSR